MQNLAPILEGASFEASSSEEQRLSDLLYIEYLRQSIQEELEEDIRKSLRFFFQND